MKHFTEARPVEILLIEDNEGDILLTLEAFKESKITNNFNICRDGEEALSYLSKQGDFINATTPDIILLDLNLPKIDGKQVLEKIKNNEKSRLIPVVVLTSSKAERDIMQSYELHANSYIVKPVDFDQFTEIVETIDNFWFSIVVLPNDTDQPQKN